MRRLRALLVLILALLLCAGPAAAAKKAHAKALAGTALPTAATRGKSAKAAKPPAENPQAKELKSQISEEKEKAKKAREEMQRLKEHEKSVTGSLAGTEKKLGELEKTVKAREARLKQLQAKERSQETNLRDLTENREQSVEELKRLLQQLWPIHAGGLGERLAGLDTWAEADRRFAWLATIYESAQKKLSEVKVRSREVEHGLTELDQAKRETEAGLAEVNAAKDEVLENKLQALRHLDEVRAKQKQANAGLDEVLGAIASLNYQLKTLPPPPPPPPPPKPAPKPAPKAPREGKAHERTPEQAPEPAPEAPPERTPEVATGAPRFHGKLPWPAHGRIVQSYAPGASPPQRGLGLALSGSSTVSAVEFGRVVHNDRLRGFGQVVILLHQNNAYSLYAFLADSNVRVGQQVQQGQAIGKAGYYPAAQGPGLYFELRLGQKPVNPADWLAE